jgi:hypothetical protein
MNSGKEETKIKEMIGQLSKENQYLLNKIIKERDFHKKENGKLLLKIKNQRKEINNLYNQPMKNRELNGRQIRIEESTNKNGKKEIQIEELIIENKKLRVEKEAFKKYAKKLGEMLYDYIEEQEYDEPEEEFATLMNPY